MLTLKLALCDIWEHFWSLFLCSLHESPTGEDANFNTQPWPWSYGTALCMWPSDYNSFSRVLVLIWVSWEQGVLTNTLTQLPSTLSWLNLQRLSVLCLLSSEEIRAQIRTSIIGFIFRIILCNERTTDHIQDQFYFANNCLDSVVFSGQSGGRVLHVLHWLL